MKLKKITIIFCCAAILLILYPKMIFAKSPNFTIKPVLPSNQRDVSVGYFDLIVSPNSEQSLEVDVTNFTNKQQTIHLYATNAKTNSNAIIDYGNSKRKLGWIKEAFSFENEKIKLAPKEQKRVKIHLKIPADEFSGTVLGGLHFESEEKKSEELIQNRFAYSLAVKLQNKEDESIDENLNLTDVRYSNQQVLTTIENQSPLIMSDLTFTYRVLDSKDKEVYSKQITKRQIVPKDKFVYKIGLDNVLLPKGDYFLEMTIHSKNQKWEWKEHFSKDTESQVERSSAVQKDIGSYNYSWYILIFLSLIILIVLNKKGRKRNEKKAM